MTAKPASTAFALSPTAASIDNTSVFTQIPQHQPLGPAPSLPSHHRTGPLPRPWPRPGGPSHLVRPEIASTVVTSSELPEERQPHLPVGIAGVCIDQTHRLPRPQFQPPPDHRQCRVRRDEGGEHVVAAVAGAAVAVLPAVVGGKQGVEGGQEVVVAARSGFEDGDAAWLRAVRRC